MSAQPAESNHVHDLCEHLNGCILYTWYSLRKEDPIVFVNVNEPASNNVSAALVFAKYMTDEKML